MNERFEAFIHSFIEKIKVDAIVSSFCYISFPKKLCSVSESKCGWFGDYLCIMDKATAVFTNCFDNPFVYQLELQMPLYSRWVTTVHSDLCDKTKERELEKILRENSLVEKQLLYSFLQTMLRIGEFTEIYSGWINGMEYSFGPPEAEHTMSLCELMDTSVVLDIKDNHKIKIVRTE